MTDDTFKILYIDDEPDNLVGFKATFRLMYQIYTATDTLEATKILREHPDIRVIFCDQRMPGKTGVDYFEELKEQFPLPIRILITAYTDVEVVINAINTSNIFRYIRKPWHEVDILSAIEEANKFYQASSLLQIKNMELKKAYEELDKFAYSVSHDLRSPLSGILSAIDAMTQMTDITEIGQMLTLVEKSIFKLEDYIAGMHDYYRSHQGELKFEDLDFQLLTEDLKSLFGIYLNANKINFTAAVEQSGKFRTDGTLIKMILNNLITNAIKYQNKASTDKRIHLSIRANEKETKIEVKDTGIGIPENKFDEIFHLFSKVTSLSTGSGIGLYNVKDAINKLGGVIEVASTVGTGTTFLLTIPAKQ